MCGPRERQYLRRSSLDLRHRLSNWGPWPGRWSLAWTLATIQLLEYEYMSSHSSPAVPRVPYAHSETHQPFPLWKPHRTAYTCPVVFPHCSLPTGPPAPPHCTCLDDRLVCDLLIYVSWTKTWHILGAKHTFYEKKEMFVVRYYSVPALRFVNFVFGSM